MSSGAALILKLRAASSPASRSVLGRVSRGQPQKFIGALPLYHFMPAVFLEYFSLL